MSRPDSLDQIWPKLVLADWQPTYQTLHLWTQVVGKIRLGQCPPLNHWWHVTFYVTSRGLTTGPIPYGARLFELQFDFVDHLLEIRTSEGRRSLLPLVAEPVAKFYERVMGALQALAIDITINTRPQEIPDAIPFEHDFRHASYDQEAVERFHRILMSTATVMETYRGRFLGKSSPVHFFWGAFDLACSRFSGRRAPPRKGVISGPGYSHEVMSVGFWPGGQGAEAAFYAYTVPKPDGYEHAMVRPAAAGWNPTLSEFLLPYDDLRRETAPAASLLEFFQSSYEAGATLAKWDRAALEPAPEEGARPGLDAGGR